MARGSVFLIGGGWDEAAFPHTCGRFVAAVGDGASRIACILVDTDDRDAYFARSAAAFAAVGASGLYPVFVSHERPLQESDVDGAAGIFVGAGLTPDYYDAIVPAAKSWLRQRVEAGIPYAGFSAGAMIAPAEGIIGGWKLRQRDTDLVICSEDVSEDEEYLDVRQGLGLAPFAVDVHASQYGMPTRLLHAVKLGMVPEGWAVDEDTMIEFSNGGVSVSGLGSACHVHPDGHFELARNPCAERYRQAPYRLRRIQRIQRDRPGCLVDAWRIVHADLSNPATGGASLASLPHPCADRVIVGQTIWIDHSK